MVLDLYQNHRFLPTLHFCFKVSCYLNSVSKWVSNERHLCMCVCARVCERVCVRVWDCESVRGCVCETLWMCDRVRDCEWQCVWVIVCVCDHVWDCEGVCVCVRDIVTVCASECDCVSQCVWVCVCVCERVCVCECERVCETLWMCDRVWLCESVCVSVCLTVCVRECVWISVRVSVCVRSVACTECTCQRQTTACAVTRTVFFQRCFEEVVTNGLFRGGTRIGNTGESLIYSPPPWEWPTLADQMHTSSWLTWQTFVSLLSFGVLFWPQGIHNIVYGFPLSKGKQK